MGLNYSHGNPKRSAICDNIECVCVCVCGGCMGTYIHQIHYITSDDSKMWQTLSHTEAANAVAANKANQSEFRELRSVLRHFT